MRPTFAIYLCALVCACASTPEKEAPADEFTIEEQPPSLAVFSGDLPDGELYRTSRGADFEKVCEELSQVDVVYVGGATASPDAARLSFQIIRQLHVRKRLDGIGLARFERKDQTALDEFSRGRIDRAALAERTGIDWTVGGAILDFARKHRITLVGLAVESDILSVVQHKGRSGLSEEQVRRIPADSGAFNETPGDANEQAARLLDDVMADTVVGWRRASPTGAQMLVLAPAIHVAHRRCLPRRARERSGGKHQTLVIVPAQQKSDAMLASDYADFIWVAGE